MKMMKKVDKVVKLDKPDRAKVNKAKQVSYGVSLPGFKKRARLFGDGGK